MIFIEHPVKRAALEAEQTTCGVWKLVRRQPSSANFCIWGADTPHVGEAVLTSGAISVETPRDEHSYGARGIHQTRLFYGLKIWDLLFP